jgi:uncharacterized protein YndB with AHSA1/START domain
MTDVVAEREIEITRVFAAPRELVWRMFTDPRELTHWWGPRGWSAPLEGIAVELEPGGAYRLLGVRVEDGREMLTDAVVRELVEPERLVLEERSSRTTIDFTDLGGRTEVRLRVTLQAPERIRRAAEAGLSSALDRLAETLEGR